MSDNIDLEATRDLRLVTTSASYRLVLPLEADLELTPLSATAEVRLAR